jgi:hypothetical protein
VRLLITGGRDYADAECMAAVLLRAWEQARIHLHERLVVVHGACGVSRGEGFDDARGNVAARLTGADGMAHRWCLWVAAIVEAERRDSAPIAEPHPADWSIGRRAGPVRNGEMVATFAPGGQKNAGEGCVAFPGGAGTLDCVRRAWAAGLWVGRPVRWPADSGWSVCWGHNWHGARLDRGTA